MAVDTKTKRLSFINLGLPWWSTLPVADGTVGVGDRLHFLHLYSGIEPVGPTGAIDGRTQAIASIGGRIGVEPSVGGRLDAMASIEGRIEVHP